MAQKSKTKLKTKSKENNVEELTTIEEVSKEIPQKRKRGRPPGKVVHKTAKRGRPPMIRKPSINGDNDYNPLTPSVSVSKRRRSVNKSESTVFSQKEKKVFYEFLKENGISCLNDEQLLQELFPNRSVPEIKAMIDGYTRKAQELNRKNEENVSGVEADPNSSKQPIEKWFDLIHQLVPNPSKKDDISLVLSDIFKELSDDLSQTYEPKDRLLEPNYQSIYECIFNALNGYYIKQMEPINAFVVVKLIEELKEVIKNDYNMKEMDFLEKGSWWLIPNQTNANKPNTDIRSISSQRRQENSSPSNDIVSESQSQRESAEDNCDQTNSVDDSIAVNEEEDINNFENLKTYPKLRKIMECLNPLKVPIDMTAEEYNRW